MGQGHATPHASPHDTGEELWVTQYIPPERAERLHHQTKQPFHPQPAHKPWRPQHRAGKKSNKAPTPGRTVAPNSSPCLWMNCSCRGTPMATKTNRACDCAHAARQRPSVRQRSIRPEHRSHLQTCVRSDHVARAVLRNAWLAPMNASAASHNTRADRTKFDTLKQRTRHENLLNPT